VTTGPTGTLSFSFAINNFFRNHVITATATDSAGNTSEFSRWIRPAENTNLPPNANAGNDATVNVGTVVLLNGRGSTDPDDGPNPLTYSWVQSGGPQVTLTGANTATPNFTPNMAGTYTFTLTVSDGQASAQDQVVIVVVAGDQGQEQAIRNLISEVQALNIPNGRKNNLLARLNGALTALNHDRVHAAINRLESFIDRVQKLSQRMMLSKAEADNLIRQAKDIIKALDRKRDQDHDNDNSREDR
jgi:K319L-like, PKD domain/FIMAH domain